MRLRSGVVAGLLLILMGCSSTDTTEDALVDRSPEPLQEPSATEVIPDTLIASLPSEEIVIPSDTLITVGIPPALPRSSSWPSFSLTS
jgi:hypothetical protein